MNHLSRLDPRSLRLFIRVLEEGTIAAAAAREHMAAAAVSKRLSELEETLRTTLLRRTNKGVEPTAAGLALRNLARAALHGLDDVYVQMRDYAAGVRGRVRVCAHLSAIVQFLPGEIASFLAGHPCIDIALEASASELTVKAVAENLVDIGVCVAMAHPEPVQAFPYHRDRLSLIVPAGHVLAGRRSVSFVDTLDFEYVGVRQGSASDIRLMERAAEHKRALKQRIEVSGYDALCHMVHAGLGIAILPKGVAAPYLKALQIRLIPLHESWAERELKVYVRRYETLPVAARMLVDHLRSACLQPSVPPEVRLSMES
jgi:DNA-binding transcriptional LysR family regulator